MSLFGYHNETAEKRRRFMRWWRDNKPNHKGKHWGELTMEELAEELAAAVSWHPDEILAETYEEAEAIYYLMQDDILSLTPLEIHERYEIAENAGQVVIEFITEWDARRSRRN